jgi:hypothetical protein
MLHGENGGGYPLVSGLTGLTIELGVGVVGSLCAVVLLRATYKRSPTQSAMKVMPPKTIPNIAALESLAA